MTRLGRSMTIGRAHRASLAGIVTCSLSASYALAAAWTPGSEAYTDEAFYESRSPRELVKYLAHPHGKSRNDAITALAARGEDALGVLGLLLTDEHPFLRASGVNAVARMVKTTEEQDEVSPVMAAGLQALRKKFAWKPS